MILSLRHSIGISFKHILSPASYHTHRKMGNKKPYNKTQGPNRGNQGQKPRLTHFLCLPLVNQTSAPQLVKSLADFQASIPLISPPAAARAEAAGHAVRIPLVPDGAMRPLGTLHLTLGVMSLTTQERVEEALAFLQSLDLVAMMREAEAEAVRDPLTVEREMAALQPLRISLASLHALPSTRSATILHAQPIDPTSRLYPFSVRLRNKFIEAGFMHCEMIKGKRQAVNANEEQKPIVVPEANNEDTSADSGGLPTIRTTSSDLPSSTEGMVPRPLLLHATIANTIYVKGRDTAGRGGQRGDRRRKEVYKFDATELLDRFGDTDRRAVFGQSQSLPRQAIPRSMATGEESRGGQVAIEKPGEKGPFVWARDIPIDRLCICEMGAKPVQHDESSGGAVLGEEYRSIGERALNFVAS